MPTTTNSKKNGRSESSSSIPMPSWMYAGNSTVSAGGDNHSISSLEDSIFGYEQSVDESSVGTMSVLDGDQASAGEHHWYSNVPKLWGKNRAKSATDNDAKSNEKEKVSTELEQQEECNVSIQSDSTTATSNGKSKADDSGDSKQVVTAVEAPKHNPAWFTIADEENATPANANDTTPADTAEKSQFTIRKKWIMLFVILAVAAIVGGVAALVAGKKQDNGEGSDASTVQAGSGTPQTTPPPIVQSTPGTPPPSPTSMSDPSPSGTGMANDPTESDGTTPDTTDQDDGVDATPTATIVPRPSPTEVSFESLTLPEKIEFLLPESVNALSNGTTPQGQALQWALAQPNPSLEQYGLATLYFSSTASQGWGTSEGGLLSNSDVCQWNGIMCVDGKVTQVEWRWTNNFSGTLPNEVSVLTDMQVLSLSGGHKITGPIPSVWGERLVNLVELDLNDNYLSGQVPSTLQHLTSLERLNLQWNNLQGPIPTEAGLMTNLVDLNLANNEITSLPSELGNAKSLMVIQAQDNDMEGTLPTDLFSLSNLSYLDLSKNDLQGSLPPESIGLLASIETLLLKDNAFTGPIPEEMSLLVNLQWLDLSKNDLSGSVPSQLGLLPNIVSLNLEDNALIGNMPAEVCGIEGLNDLKYSKNCTICQCCRGCQNQ